MSDQPNDHSAVALRPDAAPTPAPPSVVGAFLTLDLALHAAGGAPGADFRRATAYRETVQALRQKWQDGSPAPVMRAKKAVATQPNAAEAESPMASEG